MSELPSRDEVVERVKRVVDDYYREKREKLDSTYSKYVEEVKRAFLEAAKRFPEKLSG